MEKSRILPQNLIDQFSVLQCFLHFLQKEVCLQGSHLFIRFGFRQNRSACSVNKDYLFLFVDVTIIQLSVLKNGIWTEDLVISLTKTDSF